ncbi:hypothetical protein QFZ41_001364 [Luteibacter sp. W1I16]
MPHRASTTFPRRRRTHRLNRSSREDRQAMTFSTDVHAQGEAAADPFGERLRPTISVRRQILGGRFRFESDSADLLALVDAAYAGLPEHRFATVAPEFRIELRVLPREAATGRATPPPVRAQAGAGLLCGMMDEANYVVLVPAQHRGLVVVSQDMLAHPYHVRYELIEFAVFMLAARGLGLVPLHGACIGQDGRGVLLLGASGAGKSTLALQGLLDGMDFLAEDGVFVHPDNLLATGVANYLHVKEDVFRFVEDETVRAWIETSPVIHRRSGVAKFEADLREGTGRPAAMPLRLAGAVMVSAETAADPSRLLRRLPWEEVAAWLAADQPYAAGQPGWERFVHRLGGLGVYELRRGEHPRDAIAALRALLAAGVTGR